MMETPGNLQMRHLRMKHLDPFTENLLVLLILSNLENKFVVSNIHYLVYPIELPKAYINIPCFPLIKAMLNVTHLA